MRAVWFNQQVHQIAFGCWVQEPLCKLLLFYDSPLAVEAVRKAIKAFTKHHNPLEVKTLEEAFKYISSWGSSSYRNTLGFLHIKVLESEDVFLPGC